MRPRSFWFFIVLAACDLPPTQEGCEVTCRLFAECAFGAPDLVPSCTTSCVDDLETKSEACQAATIALGDCGGTQTCADFDGGACASEIELATAACRGDSEDPPDDPPTDPDPVDDPVVPPGSALLLTAPVSIASELRASHQITIELAGSGGLAGAITVSAELTSARGAVDWVLSPASRVVQIAENGNATATFTVELPSDAVALDATLSVVAEIGELSASTSTSISATRQITIDLPAGLGFELEHTALGPPLLQIRPGTLLRFHNSDSVEHVIHGNNGVLHEMAGGGFPGGDYETVVTQSGDWYCHSHEAGTAARQVIVVP